MNFKKIKADLTNVYDDLASVWGKDIAKPDWGLEELEKFTLSVKKNGGNRILDLGCGSGIQSKQLSRAGLKVTGFDLSSKMIQQAKKRVPGAQFIVGDMTILDKKIYPEPIRSETHGRRLSEGFDGVFAQASLLHIPKKLIPKVLASVYKILKRKGILYLALKEGVGEKVIEEERLGRVVKRFFSFFTKEEIEDYLKRTGFNVLEIRRFTSKPPTIWLCAFAEKKRHG